MPARDPKFPGRVSPPPEPLHHPAYLPAGEYEDLRLWGAAVVRLGATLDTGYASVSPLCRKVVARLGLRVVGSFVQLRSGTYHNGLPKYSCAGFGHIKKEFL